MHYYYCMMYSLCKSWQADRRDLVSSWVGVISRQTPVLEIKPILPVGACNKVGVISVEYGTYTYWYYVMLWRSAYSCYKWSIVEQSRILHVLLMQMSALMETWDWSMGPTPSTHFGVVWRCAVVEHGAPSVMISGVSMMDMLCAVNLDWD